VSVTATKDGDYLSTSISDGSFRTDRVSVTTAATSIRYSGNWLLTEALSLGELLPGLSSRYVKVSRALGLVIASVIFSRLGTASRLGGTSSSLSQEARQICEMTVLAVISVISSSTKGRRSSRIE
jgi:hypothetical protein